MKSLNIDLKVDGGGGHLHSLKMENVKSMVCLLLHLTLNS